MFLNIANNNDVNGKYNLFLGQELGLFDSLNITHPTIYDLHNTQVKQFWRAEDQNFANDQIQINKLDSRYREIFTETLGYQLCIDSALSANMLLYLLPFVTNNEYSEYLQYKCMMESVHARTYARIVSECYSDPNEMRESIRRNQSILDRVFKVYAPIFNKSQEYAARYMLGERPADLKHQILKTKVAERLLEGCSFNGSFAGTWIVPENTNYMVGVGKSVGSVAQDEVPIHAEEDLYVIKALIEKEGYANEWEQIKPEMEALANLAIQHEFKFNKHLLEKRAVAGFNLHLLNQYTAFCATPTFVELGFKPEFELSDHNPFPWVNRYLEMDGRRTASQETTGGNYVRPQIDNNW